jgi:hypothetical protein
MINFGSNVKDMNFGGKVIAVNLGTNRVWLPQPTPATNINATDITTTTLTLNWTSGSSTDYFEVQRKTSASGTWNVIEPNTTNTSISSTGMNQSTSYDFKVISHNFMGSIESTVYTVETAGPYTIRPSADIDVGDWSVAPLYNKLSDGLDVPFVSSTNNNGSTATVQLETPTQGGTGTVHITRRKGVGTIDPDFTWEILQDGITILQSNTISITSNTFVDTATPTTFSFQVGGNYSFKMTRKGGGNPQNRADVQVGEVWIEL